MKRIVIDVDDTLTDNSSAGRYEEKMPRKEVVEQLRKYRELDFEIVLYTARNMRTYKGNIGLINANTLPTLINWLALHDIPYDEIHVGKPWCGFEGFYVDDKTIRPDEFVQMTYDEIQQMLKIEN
ncbi:MAG: hypothetical protein P1V20_26540 [Verrucomicrobiales bacterium]|nr:hypothetical protein [Verrucomicrobiales bacterium]